MPSVVFDAVVVPGGGADLMKLGHAIEFVKDQYRHCKPMLFLGDGQKLAETAGVKMDAGDWAVTRNLKMFVRAVSKHRNWDRATDPPRV